MDMETSYQKTGRSNILSLENRPGIVRHTQRGLGYYTDGIVLFADGTIDPLPLDNGSYTYLLNERALICSMLPSLAGVTEYIKASDWMAANGYSRSSVSRLKGNAVHLEHVVRVDGVLYVPRNFSLTKGALSRQPAQVRSDEKTVRELLSAHKLVGTEDVIDVLACDNEYARRLLKRAAKTLGGYYRGGKAALVNHDEKSNEMLTPEKVGVIMDGGSDGADDPHVTP